jgi:hypothetical protein
MPVDLPYYPLSNTGVNDAHKINADLAALANGYNFISQSGTTITINPPGGIITVNGSVKSKRKITTISSYPYTVLATDDMIVCT